MNLKTPLKTAEALTQEAATKAARQTQEQFDKALDNLLGYLTRPTADGQMPFLQKILQAMPKEEAERFEIAILDRVLRQSRYLVESGDKVVLDIVNSGEFLRRVNAIKGQFGAKGQQYIDLVSKWHDKFKNDAVIAAMTKGQAHEPKMSGGLSPDPTGRFHYMIGKSIFDFWFRLMPHIPFVKPLNDKVQAAALRYYLAKTLDNTPTISSLRRKLNFDLDKGNLPLNTATRRKLKEITQAVEQGEADIARMGDEFENAKNGRGFDSPSGSGFDNTPPRTPNSPQDSGFSPNSANFSENATQNSAPNAQTSRPKSLLEQAQEAKKNAIEALDRQAEFDKQAELERNAELKAKQQEFQAQRDAAAGLTTQEKMIIDLEIGEAIPQTPIKSERAKQQISHDSLPLIKAIDTFS